MQRQAEQFSLHMSGPYPLPEWLPDETFFSWASRHHRISGASLPEQTCLALFGRPRQGYQHDFPSPLSAFVEATRGGFGDARLIAQTRTVLPFYLVHRDQATAEDAYSAIAEPNAGMLKYRLGILTSRFRANHPLKACPQCMSEDEHRHGTPYWHLRHQLPGVWVCPRHGLSLLTCITKSTGLERFSWVLPKKDQLVSLHDQGVAIRSRQALWRLTNLSMAWTSMPEASFNDAALAMTYRAQLTRAHGFKSRTAAAHAYCASVAPLQSIDELRALITSPAQAAHVLNRWVFAPRGSTHPLRHLSLIHWLFEDWQSFLSSYRSATEQQNKDATCEPDDFCSNYRPDPRKEEALARLRSLEAPTSIAKNLRLATQTVIAWGATAGIRTSRRPKQLKGETHTQVVEALQGGISKVDAAARFEISIQSVTRVLRSEVGLSGAWHQARFEAAQLAARSTWRALVAKHGGLGIKHLRQQESSVYAWLYRNDRVWLKDECQRAASVRTNNSHVLWDERDRQLSSMVYQAILTFSEQGHKRLRLVDLLAAIPELKAKQGALDRLPLTVKAINLAIPPRKSSRRHNTLL